MELDSNAIARFIENRDALAKPWLLVQWRILKLKEQRDTMSAEDYTRALAELHQQLMALGEWWKGREAEVFLEGDPE